MTPSKLFAGMRRICEALFSATPVERDSFADYAADLGLTRESFRPPRAPAIDEDDF